MLQFANLPVVASPFPHVIGNDFLPLDLYQQLVSSFPTCPPSSGPTGFSYFRGDAAYDDLIKTNPAWNHFSESVQSQAFVSHCLHQFADRWATDGCLVDIERAHYVDYVESRADKERRNIENVNLSPEQLWVRLDIAQGRVGYRRGVHLDHRRRLVTMLIYFSDAHESRMVGGDLYLHAVPPTGSPLPPLPVQKLVPKHNSMVAFACTPTSLHSVSEIKSQAAPRNFVQITVSSSMDAWPV